MLRRSHQLEMFHIWTLLLSLFSSDVNVVSLSFNYANTPIPAAFSTKCSSLGGFIVLDDTCYYTAPATLDFTSAKALCNADDAHLLSLQTIEEKEHLLDQGFLSLPTWLGLENVGEKLTWSDGFTSLNDSRILNISAGVEAPVGCALYSDSEGEVTTPLCSEAHTTVCKLKHFTTCYPGWAYEYQTDKCYRLFGSSVDSFLPGIGEKTVQEAEEFCSQYEQGHLVSSFAGAFFIIWHSSWRFLDIGAEAWVGIFYDSASSTNFVDDMGAKLDLELGWLKYPSRPDLYTCMYFTKTDATLVNETRLSPGNNTDCETRTRMFICETGTHSGTPLKEPLVNETNHLYRSQLYQVLEDRRLPNHLLRNLTARSKTTCAMKCIDMRGECLSFNFYPQGDGLPYICELNDSMESAELVLLPTNSGFYFGKEIYISS